MAKHFQIQLIWYILPFLPLSCFACHKKFRGSQTYKFNYFKDSFYGIPEPLNENMDMAVVGCVNLENTVLMSINPNKKAETMLGSQCVILFEQGDCKAGKVNAMSRSEGFHYINSFHLCSWNKFSDSKKSTQETFNEPKVILYDNSNERKELARYTDSEKDCINLLDHANKKVSSVYLWRNCLQLYKQSNCKGEVLVVQPYSDVASNLGNKVGWDNIASSIKACRSKLKGKITKFGVTSTLEDLNMDRGEEKIKIAEPKTFTNNFNAPKTETYGWKSSFKESLKFGEIQSFKLFESVEVADKITINRRGEQCIPYKEVECISQKNMKDELESAYKFQLGEIVEEWTAERDKLYNHNTTIEVPACTSRMVSFFIFVKKNISIKFELGIQISGESLGERLTAKELRSDLPVGLTYLGDVNEFEILAKAGGSMMATVALHARPSLEIAKDGPSPVCKDSPLPPTQSSGKSKQGKILTGDSDNPSSPVNSNINMTSLDPTGNTTEGGVVQSEDEFEVIEFLQRHQIYVILLGVLVFCVMYILLCVRVTHDEGRREKEIELISVGRFFLTIEFHYPCCYNR